MNNTDSTEEKDIRGQVEREQVTALWDWIWSLVKGSLEGAVLEAGCGRAVLAERIVDQNHRYLGVDRSSKLIERSVDRFSDRPDISFRTLDITTEAYKERLLEAKIDTVLTLNTMEHLKEDERFVQLTAEGLPRQGSFIILTPAMPSLFGKTDRAAGHVRRYSPDMLRSLLEAAGFQVSSLCYMNMLGLVPLIWRNFVSRSEMGYFESQSAVSLAFHNRIIPFLRTMEQYLPPPFGTSLLVKARRVSDP